MVTANGAAEPRPWKPATLWLLALGVLFFSSYNAANWLASQRAGVPAIVFAWESAVPYWPWTIVPYWSIDLFYCVSLFLCATRRELGTLARRLLTIQLISVAIFVLAPLRNTFVRPETSGIFGLMLDALLAFDKPFNQAPALHISLLVILWVAEAVDYAISAVMITALMAFLLGMAPSVAKPDVVLGTSAALTLALGGFANTALALVAAALFLSAAMTVTGLDKRRRCGSCRTRRTTARAAS